MTNKEIIKKAEYYQKTAIQIDKRVKITTFEKTGYKQDIETLGEYLVETTNHTYNSINRIIGDFTIDEVLYWMSREIVKEIE